MSLGRAKATAPAQRAEPQNRGEAADPPWGALDLTREVPDLAREVPDPSPAGGSRRRGEVRRSGREGDGEEGGGGGRAELTSARARAAAAAARTVTGDGGGHRWRLQRGEWSAARGRPPCRRGILILVIPYQWRICVCHIRIAIIDLPRICFISYIFATFDHVACLLISPAWRWC